jgi:hypothetical protein
MTSTTAAARSEFLGYVRSQLVGPFGGDTEVIVDPPNRRYLMGVLFPRNVEFEGYVESEGQETEGQGVRAGKEEDLFADDPVAAANDFLPASQGLSFFTTARTVEVTPRGARYLTLEGDEARAAVAAADVTAQPAEPVEESGRDSRKGPRQRRVWRRQQLETSPVRLAGDSPAVTQVLEGRAELHLRWRPYGVGSLVTVSLVNSAESEIEKDRAWEDMLLQAGMDVTCADAGEFLEYPSARLASTQPDELELRLQYRHARVYAVGHGCAADWEQSPDGAVVAVRTEVMPQQGVPMVSTAVSREGDEPSPRLEEVLRLSRLSDPSVPRAELVADLDLFVDGYAGWVASSRAALSGVPEWGTDAADRIVGRLETAVGRMRQGVELLADQQDGRPLEAFRLANEAMHVQMRRSESDLGGARRERSEPVPGAVILDERRWRPFQLGFVLLALAGTADPGHDDRSTVDLIWFPTGGGKTEAYLLLAAFEIFHRRLLDPVRGAGTTVLSRYTLSLLTTQQFQRAAAMVCACEDIRRRRDDLGDEPVSIGLWVGQATTKNRYKDAAESFLLLRDDDEPDDRFLLDRCPWCGTGIVPRRHSADDADYGIDATDTSFRFFCTRESCTFHDRLPVHVIDDDLYDNPPSMLLGTVDKFAGLAWESRAGCFFGDLGSRRPPTLVIQDELHLLSGPLGTTMAVYEAAIQMLCEDEGRPAKVVASTATIRRAPEQVLGLFGRTVELFPPTGLDSRDSYFATVDGTKPGRLYVGLMAQGHTADTATVHTGAALLQAPQAHALTAPDADGYWTLVVYHSSLRELGRTVTIARDDIPARLSSVVAGQLQRDFEVEELTANVPRPLQPGLLQRLNRPRDASDSIDFLATTNMLSVGVDVPRLGLMLVNGQPKATAEYIQATSRVGRGPTPGLVFSMFRSTRPRDRSHYESFKAFHASLYRHVEPTSVTPFSAPSRRRSLHAALIILARHQLGMTSDDQAGEIESRRNEVAGAVERIVDLVRRVEPREVDGTRRDLEQFVAEWLGDAKEAERMGRRLYFSPQGKGHINVMRDFYQRAHGRETLRSMRNVDRSCAVVVYKGAQGR